MASLSNRRSFAQPVQPSEVTRVSGSPPHVALVIPLLDETERLPYLLSSIPRWVNEVLLVGPTLPEQFETLKAQLQRDILWIESTGRNRSVVLQQGLRSSTGDLVIALDGENTADMQPIAEFVGELLAGAAPTNYRTSL